MEADGPSLRFFDPNGKALVALAVTPPGPALAMRGVNENSTVFLSVSANAPSLTMLDADGKVLWNAP